VAELDILIFYTESKGRLLASWGHGPFNPLKSAYAWDWHGRTKNFIEKLAFLALNYAAFGLNKPLNLVNDTNVMVCIYCVGLAKHRGGN